MDDVRRAYRSLDSAGPLATDMDSFLGGVYRYYTEGGLDAMIIKSVTNLVASVFTFILSFSVLFLIDWSAVWMCRTDVVACAHLSLLYPQPFGEISFFRFMIFCQLLILGFFTVIVFSLSSVAKIREALKISKFYREHLLIQDDREIKFLDWSLDLVPRISRYQATSVDAPICIVQPELSPIEITNLIMRFDNMLLAIMKKSMHENLSRIDSIILTSSTCRFLIQFGLISWLFDEQYKLRPELTTVAVPTFALRDQISSRLKIMGIFYMVFMFPIFIFGAFLLIIRESTNLRSGLSSLNDIHWTGSGAITLRHFSEMDHEFVARMKKSVVEYMSLTREKIWKNEFQDNLVKIGLFVSSGFLTVLALIAVLEDKALVYLPLIPGGRNLFVYFALLSLTFGILVRIDSSSHSNVDLQPLVDSGIRLVDTTHLVPSLSTVAPISSSGTSFAVFRATSIENLSFSKYFQKKFLLFLHELAAIVLIPYLFCSSASDGLVGATVSVIRSSIHRSANLGDFAKQGFFLEEQGTEIEMTESVSETKIIDMIDPEIALSVLSSYQSSLLHHNTVLSYQHESLLRHTKEFSERIKMKHSNKFDFSKFSLQFWYLLFRAVRFNQLNHSVFALAPELIVLVADEPTASRAVSRTKFTPEETVLGS